MIDDDGNIVKSVFKEMRLDEISAVDEPAQARARVTIMKRADTSEDDEEALEAEDKGEEKVKKRAALTTATVGHTHLIVDEAWLGDLVAGQTEHSYMDSGDEHSEWHSHPWIKTDDGRIVVGEVLGHTHEVDSMNVVKVFTGMPDPAETSKSTSGVPADSVGTVSTEATMSQKNDQTATNDAVAKQLAEVTKRAERAELVSELNDAQRVIFKSLDEEGQTAFLALSPEARQGEVAKAADANAVIHTDLDGVEYRKNDDPRLVQLAKRADDERTARIATEKSAKESDLRKRAEGLTNIPGTVEVRMSILKGIDALPEAEQGPAMEAMNAQNTQMSEAFKSHGTTAVSEQGNKLDAITKRFLTDDPKLTPEQAMAKALSTPEGERAYNESVGF